MMLFRAILPREAKSAALLESQCLHTAWSESQIADLPENAFYMAAFEEDSLCGIISFYCIAGEVQIMNLAVAEEHRRKGIAVGLIGEMLKKAVEKNCEIITLEVAENNISAISLYEKCGFVPVGKRKNFYGSMSALIMEKTL